jgi:hypothetical protein
MNNKIVTIILKVVVGLIFILAFFFTARMMMNGKPDSYKPDQLGIELIDQGKATNANYLEKGKEAYDAISIKIESNILAGVNFMAIILIIAAILMIGFLIYGLITTLMTDFKKGIPSLIFSGIVLLAFIWAYINSGTDTTGFDSLVSKNTPEVAEGIMSTTNFWVNGLLFVFIPGVLILLVDLVWGIIRGYSK